MVFAPPPELDDTTSETARRRPVTLKDVAALAGVGPMSVSVVLNGAQTPTRVSAATRQRILDAASELGYRRNTSAAAARSGRFGNVALLMSTSKRQSYFPQGLFFGIDDELLLSNLLLRIVRLPDEKLTDSAFLPRMIRELSCDGVLVDYNFNIPQRMVDLLEKYRIPTVWLHVEKPTDSVYADDETAAFDATTHLLQLGHHNIVHLTYISSDHESVPSRRRGYESAMQMAGLRPRVEHVNPYRKPETLLERMQAWFAEDDAPTAMFAYGADCALPAWVAAERWGHNVPDKFSLVATHHEKVLVLGKMLTCWEIPVYEMGREGVRMLLQKMERPDRALESQKLKFSIELGETCAKA